MVQKQVILITKTSFFISIILTSSSIFAYSPHPLLEDTYLLQNQITQFKEDFLIQLFQEINETKLYNHIHTIQKFGPHPTGSKALDKVGIYIYSQFESIGLSVEYDHWNVQGIYGKNIVATIHGRTNQQFIITAHYDTIESSPGADDDGSGIASILMIAEILSTYMFNQTVKFIIFSGEEIGLLGSTDYSHRAMENNTNITGVLSLDKIGYAKTSTDGKLLRHHAGRGSEWMIDISQNVSKKYYDAIGLDIVPLPFDPSSDHKSFVDNGYHGSNLVEESLNPTYHTSEDTIEHINISYLTKVTKLVLAVTTKIASLKSMLNADDLTISIRGSYHASPSCLSIVIENKRFFEDTANVSITIQLKHIFRDTYVKSIKEFYTEPCIWNFTKEINELWIYNIGARVFTQGFITIEVILYGIKDDYGLFTMEKTFGIIYSYYKFIIIPV
jgi:hypothetical protein